MNQREIGTQAEETAAAFLSNQGMRILERNFRSRQGEIDLIGMHEGYLVFVEVKYRSAVLKGSPEAAVGMAKQRKICMAADYYRWIHKVKQSVSVRYDVVCVDGGEIRWYRNAFPHRYRY